MKKNWRARFYDKKDKQISSFVVEDRTEWEAAHEVEAEAERNLLVNDWSLVAI